MKVGTAISILAQPGRPDAALYHEHMAMGDLAEPLGFDSLFLTQVAQALHSKFGIKITFRQLLGDQSSLKLLSEFIDTQLPAEALTPLERPAHREEITKEPHTPSAPADVRTQDQPLPNNQSSATEGAVERLMRDQIYDMARAEIRERKVTEIQIMRFRVEVSREKKSATANFLASTTGGRDQVLPVEAEFVLEDEQWKLKSVRY